MWDGNGYTSKTRGNEMSLSCHSVDGEWIMENVGKPEREAIQNYAANISHLTGERQLSLPVDDASSLVWSIKCMWQVLKQTWWHFGHYLQLCTSTMFWKAGVLRVLHNPLADGSGPSKLQNRKWITRFLKIVLVTFLNPFLFAVNA